MKQTVKYLLYTLATFIILSIVVSPILGAEHISRVLGFDIENIDFVRDNHPFHFSLTSSYPALAILGGVVATLLAIVARHTDQMFQKLKKAIKFFTNYVTDTYKDIKTSPIKFVLLIPFLIPIYYAFTMPVHVDECMTYLSYARLSFWDIISIYTMPNNHILHTLLVWLSIKIPFVDLNILIRLPALLATILSVVFLYRFTKKHYGEKVAFFVTATAPLLLSSIEYSYLSRGYSMLTLFTIICLYAAFNIVHNDNEKKSWYIFTLSAILGAYTVPTFLYPFLSISIYIICFKPKSIKKLLTCGSIIGLGVLLLYSPVLLVSGIELLTNNRYVAPVSRWEVVKTLPSYFMGVYIYIIGFNKALTIIIITLPILYCIFKKNKKMLALWIIFMFTPALFISIHSVQPFFRVFFYNAFIFVFLYFASFKDLLNKLNIRITLIVSLTMQIILAYNFNNKVEYLQRDAIIANTKTLELLENNTNYYYCDFVIVNLFVDHLKYESARTGFTNTFTIGTEANADKIVGFDKVLIIEHQDKTETKAPNKKVEIMFYEKLNIYSE